LTVCEMGDLATWSGFCTEAVSLFFPGGGDAGGGGDAVSGAAGRALAASVASVVATDMTSFETGFFISTALFSPSAEPVLEETSPLGFPAEVVRLPAKRRRQHRGFRQRHIAATATAAPRPTNPTANPAMAPGVSAEEALLSDPPGEPGGGEGEILGDMLLDTVRE
jgi:hypothetical protein